MAGFGITKAPKHIASEPPPKVVIRADLRKKKSATFPQTISTFTQDHLAARCYILGRPAEPGR
jgi:hypothetical protein